ncbi:hypothetical protein FQZ97_1208970 [compost metagenome]
MAGALLKGLLIGQIGLEALPLTFFRLVLACSVSCIVVLSSAMWDSLDLVIRRSRYLFRVCGQ